MTTQRQAILNALGIEQWQLRGQPQLAEVEHTHNKVNSNIQQPLEQERSEPIQAPTPQNTTLNSQNNAGNQPEDVLKAPETAPVMLNHIALPDFSASDTGNIVVLLSKVDDSLDESSRALLSAMLKATKWPAEQCSVVLCEANTPDPALLQWLAQYPRKLLLVMGDALTQQLAQKSLNAVSTEHNQTALWSGMSVVFTHHPTQAVKNEALKRPIWEALKCAMQRLT